MTKRRQTGKFSELIWFELFYKAGSFVLLLVLFYIITNLPLLVGIISQTRVLRYAVEAILEHPALKITVPVMLGILILVAFLGIFSLFFCCLCGHSILMSMKKSIKLFGRYFTKLTGRIVRVNIGLGGAEVLLYLFLLVIVEGITFWLVLADTKLVIMASVLERYSLCFWVAVSSLNTMVNIELLRRLFYQYNKEEVMLQGEALLVDGKHWLCSHVCKKQCFAKLRLNKVVAISGILVFIAVFLVNFFLVIRDGGFLAAESMFGIQITAHRGESSKAPENTLVALEAAIEGLADYAEIDVQQTKDGMLVLMHDSSLRRTTGVKKYIWEVTYEELCGYEAGSWLSEEYAGEKVPTLQEALELCKGRMNLNIEIKPSKYNQGLEQKVVEWIEAYDSEHQCIVSSTSHEVLRTVKELNANIKTGYIMTVAYGNFYDWDYIDFFSIKSVFITQTLVMRAHEQGKEVHAWTVNTESELERMKGLYVDNIITDNSMYAREILYREKVTETLAQLLRLLLNQK